MRTYTTAPKSFDHSATRTLTEIVAIDPIDNMPVRLVEVPHDVWDWQRNRYLSGRHMLFDDVHLRLLIGAGALIEPMY